MKLQTVLMTKKGELEGRVGIVVPDVFKQIFN